MDFCPTEPVALLAIVSMWTIMCFSIWFGWWARGIFETIRYWYLNRDSKTTEAEGIEYDVTT